MKRKWTSISRIPELVRTLNRAGPFYGGARAQRVVAAMAICIMGRRAKDAAPVLAKIINNKRDPAWELAILGFGRLGVPKRQAVPGLILALRDKFYSTRERAAVALGVTKDECDATRAALERALGDEFRVVRFAAARALAMIGYAALPAAPALRRLEDDAYDSIRKEARRTLRKIGAGRV